MSGTFFNAWVHCSSVAITDAHDAFGWAGANPRCLAVSLPVRTCDHVMVGEVELHDLNGRRPYVTCVQQQQQGEDYSKAIGSIMGVPDMANCKRRLSALVG